jgi:hypothetical protein
MLNNRQILDKDDSSVQNLVLCFSILKFSQIMIFLPFWFVIVNCFCFVDQPDNFSLILVEHFELHLADCFVFVTNTILVDLADNVLGDLVRSSALDIRVYFRVLRQKINIFAFRNFFPCHL